MSKDLTIKDPSELSGLSDDELKEMVNRFAEKCAASARRTVADAITCGIALLAMRERIPHGEWRQWLAVNFDYSARTAETYITLASNAKRFAFEKPESIRAAMKMISDEKEAESPKPKSAHVEVVDPPSKDTPDHIVDANKKEDPDQPPAPPTNRKTAKGSEKVKEADKPRTQPVVAEIVDEPEKIESDPVTEWLASLGLRDAVMFVLEHADVEESNPVKQAKMLRKIADSLDPPATVEIPTNLQSEAFQTVWDSWIRFRKRKRVSCLPECLSGQLKDLSEWGQADAIYAIEHSIKQGYTGLFRKGTTNGNGRATAPTTGRIAVPKTPTKINYK